MGAQKQMTELERRIERLEAVTVALEQAFDLQLIEQKKEISATLADLKQKIDLMILAPVNAQRPS